MAQIVEEHPYNGVTQRIERLGLAPLLDELRTILQEFPLLVEERRDANGGAAVRKMIDERFEQARGWEKKQTGDVDWTKCHTINGARVCVGVEIQFSARSDLIVIDVIHLPKRHVREARADDLPLLLIALEHGGPGPALAKQAKRR